VFLGLGAGAVIRSYQPAAAPAAARPAVAAVGVGAPPNRTASAAVGHAEQALPAAMASSASVRAAPLAAIKHQGAPASAHPPIAPRTPREAHVNAVAAKRIGSHIKLARWIILAISVWVLIGTAVDQGIAAGIGAGILSFLVLLGVWTGCEHLAAHFHVQAKLENAGSPQSAAPGA
jgi:hypothetical protein